jgi:hypothetical protein
MSEPRVVEFADELVHPADPADWSWNESWFFSWIDLAGGPAGFFRIGLLPNQQRAMLWCFVNVDGRWLGVEEGRLNLDHVDTTEGAAYNKWNLRFGWKPDPPLAGARFTFAGDMLVRAGSGVGTYIPVEIDLACSATAGTFLGKEGTAAEDATYEDNRFEQPMVATGSIVVDGVSRPIAAGAQRDRAWGPRDWRQLFAMGDFQAPGRQLYFVGRTFPGLGMGFVRHDGEDARHLLITDGHVDFDDRGCTIDAAWLRLEGEGVEPIEVTMKAITPSVVFDLAHSCDPPERWLAWRTLVEAQVTGWADPCRGWFDTGRYGAEATLR